MASPRTVRPCAPAGHLARLVHGRDHRWPPPRSSACVGVQRHHAGAAAQRLEGVPPGAAAQVEHPVTRADREPAEVHGQHARAPSVPSIARAVLVHRGPGHRGPGEPFLHPPPGGRAQPLPLGGRVEQVAQRGRQLLRVARARPAARRPRSPRAARRSGWPPAASPTPCAPPRAARTPRTARGRRRSRRWRSSSASSSSLIPCTNRTRSPRASSPASRSVGPPGAGLPTTVSCGVAFRGQLGHRREQRGDPLQRRVRAGHGHDPAGHPGRRPGMEQPGVHAERDDVHVAPGRPGSRGRCRPGRTPRRSGSARPGGPPGPASGRTSTSATWPAAAMPVRRGQLDPPVHADRVVDAGHQRQAEPGQAEHAVGQHLVVVHQVEVGPAGRAARAARAG